MPAGFHLRYTDTVRDAKQVALVCIFFANSKRRGAAIYASVRKDSIYVNFADI